MTELKDINKSDKKVGRPKEKLIPVSSFVGWDKFEEALEAEFNKGFPNHLNLACTTGILIEELEEGLKTRDKKVQDKYKLLRQNFLRAEYQANKYANKALATKIWSLTHNIAIEDKSEVIPDIFISADVEEV